MSKMNTDQDSPNSPSNFSDLSCSHYQQGGDLIHLKVTARLPEGEKRGIIVTVPVEILEEVPEAARYPLIEVPPALPFELFTATGSRTETGKAVRDNFEALCEAFIQEHPDISLIDLGFTMHDVISGCLLVNRVLGRKDPA